MLGLLLGLPARLFAQPTAAPDAAVIEDCRYPDVAAAQPVWKPMGASAPVLLATEQGHQALRLRCNFAGTALERASWDRTVKLDLAACRGLEFKLLCRDATPVSYFSIYFQSGAGWYHANFYPETSNTWNTITIDKATTGAEGKPAGWGQISTIRISAWRGMEVDTEFFISDLRQTGVLGGDALVAIVRGESVARQSPGEARSVEQFTEGVARQLGALEVGCAVLSDLDVTAERLKPARLVVLPHNPQMPERVADELVRYLQAGGKVLAFYSVPDKLRPLLRVDAGRHVRAESPGQFSSIRFADQALPGAPTSVGQQSWNINALQPLPGGRVLADWLDDKGRPTGHAAVLGSSNGIVMTHVLLADDPVQKRRMLLAMVGSLVPAVWQQAVSASLARVGALSDFSSFEEAATRIAQMDRNDPKVAQALATARDRRELALRRLSDKQYAQALDAAQESHQRLEEAFCRAQPSLPGEFRAFWCHSAFGLDGLEWDEAIRRLATNGFTAILPNMLWGGAAYYDSKVLPAVSPAAQKGDQIAKCLAACRKYGVQMHVWKVNWNLGHAVPKEFLAQMRSQGRLQMSSKGAEEPWLCPSHPDNQKLEVASLVEVARNYDVDGLHFDYIRYPDGDHCFCPGCKERFQQATGVPLRNWPQDVLGNGPHRQPWLDWRRGNITAVVRAVSEQARTVRPRLKISAAVFPNWNTDRDGVGQDWKLWCERGYLDFVCPMDYTPSTRRFDNLVARQVQWAGRVPCYPGLGVSASSSQFGADRAIEQIQVTRRHHTGGFVIFNYGKRESEDLLPLLGLGITAPAK